MLNYNRNEKYILTLTKKQKDDKISKKNIVLKQRWFIERIYKYEYLQKT